MARKRAAAKPPRDEIELAFRETRSADATAAQLGIPVGKVRARLSELGLLHLTVERGQPRDDAPWPAERVVEALKKAAGVLGEPLSVVKYQRLRAEVGGDEYPTPRTVALRLGSWRAGCVAAGVAHGTRGRVDAEADRPDSEVEAAVFKFAHESWAAGRKSTIASYSSWARETGAPSRSTVQARFGSWTAAMQAAAAAESVTGGSARAS